MATRTLRSALLFAAVLLPLAGGLCMACVTCTMADGLADVGTVTATSSPCHQHGGPAARAAGECCCAAGETAMEPAMNLSPALAPTAALDVAPTSVAPTTPRAATFDQERVLGRSDRCALNCTYRI